MPGCETQAFGDAFADSSSLIRFSGSFEGDNARLKVLYFNRFRRMVQNAVRGSHFGGWWRRRLQHDFAERRNSCAGEVMQPPNRLTEGRPLGRTKGEIEGPRTKFSGRLRYRDDGFDRS